MQGGSTTKPRKTLPLNGAKEVSLATLPSTTKPRRTLPLNGATLYHRTTQTLPLTRASSATEWSRLYHQTTHPIPSQRTTALLSGFFIRPLLYILIKEYLPLSPWLAPGGKGKKKTISSVGIHSFFSVYRKWKIQFFPITGNRRGTLLKRSCKNLQFP